MCDFWKFKYKMAEKCVISGKFKICLENEIFIKSSQKLVQNNPQVMPNQCILECFAFEKIKLFKKIM